MSHIGQTKAYIILCEFFFFFNVAFFFQFGENSFGT